jgi:hypothetical protein
LFGERLINRVSLVSATYIIDDTDALAAGASVASIVLRGGLTHDR